MKELILEILLPYKENPETCAITNDTCYYLLNGKKCAVGKMMKEGKWQHEITNIEHLLELYSKEEMIQEKYQVFDTETLSFMQFYHDSYVSSVANYAVQKLEEHLGIELPELLN